MQKNMLRSNRITAKGLPYSNNIKIYYFHTFIWRIPSNSSLAFRPYAGITYSIYFQSNENGEPGPSTEKKTKTTRVYRF